ncbi:MAG: RNA methyltransferase [Candidatus Competibacterales bacterium]
MGKGLDSDAGAATPAAAQGRAEPRAVLKADGAEIVGVRVVLVATSHPGNIGAAARAMKTMGLTELWLVAPEAPFPCAEATAMASGADDVLHRARVVSSLDEAIADCGLVLGTTARPRQLASQACEPRDAAQLAVAAAANRPVALLFGRERSGLTNAELDHCQRLVHIPTAPGYRSLNLAAAVQIIAYELWRAAADFAAGTEGPGEVPATAAELERLYHHGRQVLVAIDFLDPANPRQLMRRLRRLFHRTGLTSLEVNILRGILTAVDKIVDRFDEDR